MVFDVVHRRVMDDHMGLGIKEYILGQDSVCVWGRGGQGVSYNTRYVNQPSDFPFLLAKNPAFKTPAKLPVFL